ncbi:MAG: hypothetical protein JSS72_02850 [Armatimonadetes bacterium]|nr:hypothetical protein [Armatimonadota bacterium]
MAVGPVDARGYHPIRTVFQTITLFDTLEVELADKTSITCNWSDFPAENTLTKMLRLAREIHCPELKIHLTKRIPAQSGLGGGSSDAVGVLKALERLSPVPLTPEHQMDFARAVGADVPFFLLGGTAKGEGYGEKLTPLPDGPTRWLVVARPDEGVDTAKAYKRLDETERPFKEFEDGLYNDFERVAPCGSLELIDRLRVHGASEAGLTGSGSAVFGWMPDQGSADKVADKLKREGWPYAEAARTLARSEIWQDRGLANLK